MKIYPIWTNRYTEKLFFVWLLLLEEDPHTELDNLISTELDNCLISTELDSEISTQLDNCQISTQLDKINFT